MLMNRSPNGEDRKDNLTDDLHVKLPVDATDILYKKWSRCVPGVLLGRRFVFFILRKIYNVS